MLRGWPHLEEVDIPLGTLVGHSNHESTHLYWSFQKNNTLLQHFLLYYSWTTIPENSLQGISLLPLVAVQAKITDGVRVWDWPDNAAMLFWLVLRNHTDLTFGVFTINQIDLVSKNECHLSMFHVSATRASMSEPKDPEFGTKAFL